MFEKIRAGDHLGLATAMFSTVVIIWLKATATQSNEVLNVLVGALSAGYLQTLNYYFGSTSVRSARMTPSARWRSPP